MHSRAFHLAVLLAPWFGACATSNEPSRTEPTAASSASSSDTSFHDGQSPVVPSSTVTPVNPGTTSNSPHTDVVTSTGDGSSGADVIASQTAVQTETPPDTSSQEITGGGVSETAHDGTADGTHLGTDVSATSEVTSADFELTPTKVYLAGDSTVSTYRDTASTTDQAGWGQMLHEYLSELAVVDNRAVGGTTSRSFIDFGHFDEIAAGISPGDTLLVQFGTNDGNKTATYELDGQEIPYYLDPATDYKTYLTKYIDLAADKSANLIFVTPPPRNSAYCTGGNGTGGHAQAMRELGAERAIAVADLNLRSVDYLKAICPSPTPEDFFALRADGSVDGTHFQENGARILARLVADEIKDSNAKLSHYVEEAALASQ